MKYVEAIIRPDKYVLTKEKLAEKGYYSALVLDIIGRGKGDRRYELAKGEDDYIAKMSYKAKKYIGMYLADEDVDKVVDIILDANSTGNSGDGKIFISNLENAIRISSGVQGVDAIV